MEKEGLKELQYDLNYLDDNEVQQLIKSIKNTQARNTSRNA